MILKATDLSGLAKRQNNVLFKQPKQKLSQIITKIGLPEYYCDNSINEATMIPIINLLPPEYQVFELKKSIFVKDLFTVSLIISII